MRHSIALLITVLPWCLACNSTRDNSCVAPSTAILGAGTSPSSCEGECGLITIPDAGDASVSFCFIDCTSAGQSKCDFGRTCVSLAEVGLADSSTSYCLHQCATTDGGADAGTCPPGYTCDPQFGVCF